MKRLDSDVAVVLDDIYAKLRIDEEWSVREERCFTWWGHRLAQRVSVEKPRLFANQPITKLNIETDLWRDVPRTEKTAALVKMLNYTATLSAFVWDQQRGTIRLHASLYLDAENVETVTYLALNVTAMQAADAYIKIDGLCSLLKATPDESLHPTSGRRHEPDDMLNVIEQVYAPLGKGPSRFSEIDFESLAKTEAVPWVLATAGLDGLTAEFPFFGSEPAFLTLEGPARTALFQVNTDAPHPQLGNGVLLRLTLPVDADPVTLNLAESQEWTAFNQLGAWFHNDRGVSFVTFIPNATFREGLLENLFWHTAARVKWAKETLFPSVPGFFRPMPRPALIARNSPSAAPAITFGARGLIRAVPRQSCISVVRANPPNQRATHRGRPGSTFIRSLSCATAAASRSFTAAPAGPSGSAIHVRRGSRRFTVNTGRISCRLGVTHSIPGLT